MTLQIINPMIAGQMEVGLMTQFKNVMEIFNLLDKSNCRKCNEKTCLAFAAAVFQGQKQLDQCPLLESNIITKYEGNAAKQTSMERDQDRALEELKNRIATIDLASSAQRLDGVFLNKKLTLKIFGKDFSVDSQGNFYSDIHVNPWVTLPVFSYILHSNGNPVSGTWMPFRELKNGKMRAGLFRQMCEIPLKKVADTYTELFRDMILIFNGKKVEKHYEADISLVLHPLPKVPILICYWEPEDGLESSLNLFFDSTVEEHLPIEAVNSLGTGLTRMFQKIALRHGSPKSA